ncbi:MAG: cytochrome c peroxidase [Bacteroidota bacterium]
MYRTKRIKWMVPVGLVLGLFILASFSLQEQNTSAAQTINKNYLQQMDQLILEAQNLLEAAKVTATEEDLPKLQSQLLETRNQYKRIEFLAAYSDPDHVNRFVNGAPLKKLDLQEDATIVILEPKGLQILDELIFSETPLEEVETIQKRSQFLISSLAHFKMFQARTPITDREVFEALRQHLIRILTLGITGFDTPLSGNALPEAKIGMESIQNAYAYYIPTLSKKDAQLAETIEATLEASIQYLGTHMDFDTFDRMHFLKTYLNPLYKDLLSAQLTIGIETIYEVTNLTQPINYHVENIFDADLINSSFFTEYEAGEDHPTRIELGKMLFFDPVLSVNNERSCASCHQPDKAFTDGQKKSLALDFEGTILRNSPTLINSVYAEKFFHDLRAARLEDQMEHVVFDKKEFNTSFGEIFDKLSKSEEYVKLFRDAFPHISSQQMNPTTLTNAISAYIRTLQGLNSPVDKYIRGEAGAELSESAIRGFNLFMGKAACGTCHFAPVFNGSVPPKYIESESEVLGIPVSTDTLNPEIDPDLGRYANGRHKEKAEIYLHSFKTPTVRNIALTAPYMHNGVYETLEEVMDFYNKGGGTGLGIDVPNQTLPFDSLGLNTTEISDIITFMEALTDTVGLTHVPTRLPTFPEEMDLNDRVIGGKY